MQNKNNKNNKVAAAMFFLIIAFVFGIFVGGAIKGDNSAKQEKVTDIVSNTDAWKHLKETDDRVIKLALAQTELCSAAMYAVSNGDNGTLSAVSKELEKNKTEFKVASDERVNATKALGY